jgi:hypothetical protein
MQAKGQDTPGDAHGMFRGFECRGVGGREFLNEFRWRCRPIEFMWITLVPESFDVRKLLLALEILVLWLKR